MGIFVLLLLVITEIIANTSSLQRESKHADHNPPLLPPTTHTLSSSYYCHLGICFNSSQISPAFFTSNEIIKLKLRVRKEQYSENVPQCLAKDTRRPRCCLCVCDGSLCCAVFCTRSPWAAELEEPRNRQMDSPSRSSRSWNTLPLNNEVNLSSASGGGPGSHPQLSAQLC